MRLYREQPGGDDTVRVFVVALADPKYFTVQSLRRASDDEIRRNPFYVIRVFSRLEDSSVTFNRILEKLDPGDVLVRFVVELPADVARVLLEADPAWPRAAEDWEVIAQQARRITVARVDGPTADAGDAEAAEARGSGKRRVEQSEVGGEGEPDTVRVFVVAAADPKDFTVQSLRSASEDEIRRNTFYNSRVFSNLEEASVTFDRILEKLDPEDVLVLFEVDLPADLAREFLDYGPDQWAQPYTDFKVWNLIVYNASRIRVVRVDSPGAAGAPAAEARWSVRRRRVEQSEDEWQPDEGDGEPHAVWVAAWYRTPDEDEPAEPAAVVLLSPEFTWSEAKEKVQEIYEDWVSRHGVEDGDFVVVGPREEPFAGLVSQAAFTKDQVQRIVDGLYWKGWVYAPPSYFWPTLEARQRRVDEQSEVEGQPDEVWVAWWGVVSTLDGWAVLSTDVYRTREAASAKVQEIVEEFHRVYMPDVDFEDLSDSVLGPYQAPFDSVAAASGLSPAQLQDVIDELDSQGWAVRTKSTKQELSQQKAKRRLDEQSEVEWQPDEVWVAVGFRLAELVVYVALSTEVYPTRSDAEAKVAELVEDFELGDIAVYGPDLEKFEDAVEGLSADQVQNVIDQLRAQGWAYVPLREETEQELSEHKAKKMFESDGPPDEVWEALWGFRFEEPAVYVALSTDVYPTRADAEAKVDELVEDFARGGWRFMPEIDFDRVMGDIAVYGPDLEKFEDVVEGLSEYQVQDVIEALRAHGWAYIPKY